MARLFVSLVLILTVVWLGVLNTQPVNLITIPQEFVTDKFGIFRIPLFLIIIFTAFLSFVFGCVAEYIRSRKLRKSLKERDKRLKQSEAKLKKFEKNLGLDDDDILSLLK